MSRYRFELAGRADDADLRHVLANTPMPGDIALTFCREPSFFAAPGVDGFACQIVACRDTTSGRIVGFGCRSLRRVYVNGQAATIGYLSSLRLLAEHRNRGLVARGYRYFRALHADGQTPLYLTTIAEGNAAALGLLTSARAGLPRYHAAGRHHTIAVPIGLRSPYRPPRDLYVRNATQEDLPTIVSFLEKYGRHRQFFPRYEASDVLSADGALAGLRADDIMLAYRSGALVGTLAGWDQQAFRQTLVHGYRALPGWLRAAYNGWARLRRRLTLPKPGQRLRYLTAALPMIVDDDAPTLVALLQALLRRAAKGPWDSLVLGLSEEDPLLTALAPMGGTRFTTRIFHVTWPDGEGFRQALDSRPRYLELGSL